MTVAVEVTYAQYVEAGGIAPEEAFDGLIGRATACVDYIIGPNEVTDEDVYRRAVFAALGAYAEGNATGAGFTLGSFRMEGTAGGRSGADADARRAAYEVLATTGMAWAGLA